MGILFTLLFHSGDILTIDKRNESIIPIIQAIPYNRLNKANKQFLNSLLETTRARAPSQQDNFYNIIKEIEKTIFDRREATSAPDGKDSSEDAETKKIIDESVVWINKLVLPNIDFRGFNRQG